MQLTDYRKFEDIVDRIREFRRAKALNKGNYRKFFQQYIDSELRKIYADELAAGDISTRESRDSSEAKFLKTKRSNLRDYTDACFRYLRATELVSISQIGHSVRVAKGKEKDVEYILANVGRAPVFTDDLNSYKRHLFDATAPTLLTDDRTALLEQLSTHAHAEDIQAKSLVELKLTLLKLREQSKQKAVDAEVHKLKNFENYEDVQSKFDGIVDGEYYDNPLMLEWNTWRAMTMIDGGDIAPNFKLDDEGLPLSTAVGNIPDIVCNYEDFNLIVEVTLQSGQKQYDNEGEPVARHLGKIKEASTKEAYCLFVAPKLSPASIAHFYGLHKISISHYGGTSVIVPLELQVYRKMLEDANEAGYTPESHQLRAIFEASIRFAEDATNEIEWHEQISNFALNWLSPDEIVHS